jgi:Zinc-ribbon, C4HC2 type
MISLPYIVLSSQYITVNYPRSLPNPSLRFLSRYLYDMTGSDRQAFPGIVCTFSAQAIEQLLCTYAETLRRWSATLQATEVTKHMRSDHTKHNTKRDDAGAGQVSSPLKESTPDKLTTAPTLEWDAGADYVTLVRLGVNCPKCGVSTESRESSCTAPDKAEYRESDESRGYPAYTEREIKGRVTKNAAWCTPCKDYALTCSLCQMPIRGAGYFCTSCGHGGHTDHMREWFEQTVECASGCGCRCGELAQLGHSAGVTKSKYAQEWEEGSEHRGGTTGSKTHSASDSLPGSTRHSLEREAAVHERQGSGSDYFHYHSDSSESDDHSTSSSERGEDSFGSEYTSGTDSVGDDEGLQAASRGNQAGLKEGLQRMKERRQDGSKSNFDEINYPAFGQDWDN